MGSMLFNTDLLRKDLHLLWTETIGTTAYLCNRMPNGEIMNTVPYSEWYGKKPNVSHLQVFETKAFVHISDSMSRKIDLKAREVVFAGCEHYIDMVHRVLDIDRRIIE